MKIKKNKCIINGQAPPPSPDNNLYITSVLTFMFDCVGLARRALDFCVGERGSSPDARFFFYFYFYIYSVKTLAYCIK